MLQSRGSVERSDALELLVPRRTTVWAPVNKILFLGGRGGGLLV